VYISPVSDLNQTWIFSLNIDTYDNSGATNISPSVEVDLSDLGLSLGDGPLDIFETFVEYLNDTTLVAFATAHDGNGKKVLVGQAVSTTGETIGNAFSVDQFNHPMISGDSMDLTSYEHDFVALSDTEFVIVGQGEATKLDNYNEHHGYSQSWQKKCVRFKSGYSHRFIGRCVSFRFSR
jgi:hypothetical protein